MTRTAITPNLIICPKCRCRLDSTFLCPVCNEQYSSKYGVYNIVSQDLSGNQKIYWEVTDEMIEDSVPRPDGIADTSLIGDYESRKNEETKLAEQMQERAMDAVIAQFTGRVCDLATGRGIMLSSLLRSPNKNFSIVCTDIDPHILAWTRKLLQTDDTRVSYVAADGRYLSLESDSFDYVTSYAGFGNIPESDKVAAELYRILKPGGMLAIRGNYILKGSNSHMLAKEHGLERGMIEEFLTEDLKNAGFGEIRSTVVAEAVWAENPYDVLPAAGDLQRYCIIQAVKPSL